MKPAKIIFLLYLTSWVTLNESCKAQTLLMTTDKGTISIKMNPKKAPITCENFMKYVTAGKYDGAKFYRTVRMNNQADKNVKIEVIQAGLQNDTTGNFPAIVHETTKMTSLKHLNGTVSMARTKPGSATSEFFICINDQPELDFAGKRNPDGQGFAAFGTVISGMEVVKKIQAGKTGEAEFSQTLELPVRIIKIKKLN